MLLNLSFEIGTEIGIAYESFRNVALKTAQNWLEAAIIYHNSRQA